MIVTVSHFIWPPSDGQLADAKGLTLDHQYSRTTESRRGIESSFEASLRFLPGLQYVARGFLLLERVYKLGEPA